MNRTHSIHSFATRFALAACAVLFATGTATARICVTSDASAAVYDDGLQDGDNDANGFGPWVLTPISDNPADNQFLVAWNPHGIRTPTSSAWNPDTHLGRMESGHPPRAHSPCLIVRACEMGVRILRILLAGQNADKLLRTLQRRIKDWL